MSETKRYRLKDGTVVDGGSNDGWSWVRITHPTLGDMMVPPSNLEEVPPEKPIPPEPKHTDYVLRTRPDGTQWAYHRSREGYWSPLLGRIDNQLRSWENLVGFYPASTWQSLLLDKSPAQVELPRTWHDGLGDKLVVAGTGAREAGDRILEIKSLPVGIDRAVTEAGVWLKPVHVEELAWTLLGWARDARGERE